MIPLRILYLCIWLWSCAKAESCLIGLLRRDSIVRKRLLSWIKVIVGVVQACHSLSVMHRDLKPEFFLFESPDEDAKLKAIDFGLSVFYKPGQVFCDVVGSPYYVAPEVLCKRYGPEIDGWCDPLYLIEWGSTFLGRN
ncbi:unnamed protein product [Rhodiola kirilowii]